MRPRSVPVKPCPPYHAPMRRFLRGGNAGSALTIAGGLALSVVVGVVEAHASLPRGWTVAILVAGVPAVLALGWLISAKLAADLADVRRENALEREHERELGARFAARRPRFEVEEEAFAGLVEEELAALPAWIAAAIRKHNVAFTVEDERVEEPRTLGLYRLDRGTAEITLYRVALLRAAGDAAGLRRVVHDTLLHELGHLFGMSEADLDRFSIGNNPRPDAHLVHPPKPRRRAG
jgi:predicted Zn-dependent protease with MMP-like domain